MDRPTVFISSTIYDFHDLRSAIKNYLEESGCRVLASEYNDFTKPLDRHSYQACLDTIPQADIFLLLVGTRVGGWHHEPTRVSITQQEYRTAYALARVGKIRLLSFVRAEVWNHRQGSKEMQKHLTTLSEVDDDLRQKIMSRPSAFASDSEFIVSFIDEISRNKETADAVRGKGEMPIGNWIHPFGGFVDVRDVLDPLIFNGLPVRKAAGRKALQNQLLSLLRDILPLINDEPLLPATSVHKLAATINLKGEDLKGSVTLSDKIWNRLAYLAVLVPPVGFSATQFSSVLSTDLLLEYDPANGTFRQTPAYDVLTDLIDQLTKFNKARDAFNWGELISFGHLSKRAPDKSVKVPAHLIAHQLHLLFRWMDIGSLAIALVQALDGKPLVLPTRMPLSPFVDQENQIAKEQVTLDQVRQYVGLA